VAAGGEAFEQTFEFLVIAVEPFERDLFHGGVKDIIGHMTDAFDPGLEVVQCGYAAVDGRAVVETVEGCVRESPIRAVKEEAVIDHGGDEGRAGRVRMCDLGAVEDALAGVGVAGEAVKDVDTEEVVEVGDLGEEGVGKKVEDGDAGGVTWVARAEVAAGIRGSAAGSGLNMKVRVGRGEGVSDLDEGGLGRGDLEIAEELRAEPLVDEDAAVLGVVLKLDDVAMAVVGLQQMSLGASAHAAEERSGKDRHP